MSVPATVPLVLLRALALCCLLLPPPAADADARVRGFFERFGTDRGLSQQTVTALAQDRAGFLWIGTQAGLNRFDGYEFTVFLPRPDDPDALSDAYVNALQAAPDGSLWIGTDTGGLNHYNPETERFSTWRHRPGLSISLAANRVFSLLLDRRGRLWVGTERGLDRFDAQRGAFMHFGGGAVQALHQDGQGRIWAGTEQGLYRLSADGTRLLRVRDTPAGVRALSGAADGALWVGTGDGLWLYRPDAASWEAAPPAGQMRDLLLDAAGRLWAASRTGLWRRERDGSWRRFTHDRHDAWSLPRDIVFSLFEDRQGVIWVGTYGGGLARHVPWKNAFQRYRHDPDDPDSLSQNIVFPIYQDRAGMLWIGTYNRGLDRLDPVSGRVRHFRHRPGDPHSLSGNEVRAVLEDSRSRLWVGTNHNGLNLLDRDTARFTRFRHDPANPASLSHDSVVALAEAPQGDLWVGTWGGGLNRFDPDSGRFRHYRHEPDDPHSLSHDRVMALHMDRQGTLWIGTDGGGLNRFDPAQARFIHYRHRPGDPASLSHDTVEAIHEDARGRLWIATRHGLNRFDPRTGRFRQYLSEDGLADNLVLGLAGDAGGRLWISTNRGLSRLDPATGRFRNFLADDGPGMVEYNSFAHHAGRDGRLYFGGIEGLVAFRPEAVRPPPAAPPLRLTGLRLFNEPLRPRPGARGAVLDRSITYTDRIVLDHRQSVITFEFAALDTADADDLRYAYRMQGLDSDWIETSALRRLATYTYPPSGDYRFQLRVRDPDGGWRSAANATSLAVTVRPPPWRSGWAYAGYALAGLLLLAGIFFAYRQRLIARHMARERDAAERTARLKSSFLAIMSHEIRTPLNGMLGMLELLRNSRLETPQRDYVETLHYAGQALLAILNDVLDYSRIESGQIAFEQTDFDLRRLLESLITLMSARAGEKGLALELELDDAVPARLRGDPARLRQVLLNLLGNAIKFTTRGGVVLRVRPAEAGAGGIRLHFEVADTGPGIAPDRQAQLFRDYVQAEASITRRYGGSGLGLAICRRLVEGQGGQIGVESQPGHGATFWFELPFQPAAEARPAQEASQPALRPLRVLLVDDVELNREVAVGLLRLDGHRVVEAENGRQALRLLDEQEFDLVLMDLRMPDLDGVEATRRIRTLSDPLKAAVPVIGLTASVEPAEVDRCLDAGMNRVLRKPVTLDALRQALAGAPLPRSAAGQAPLLDEQLIGEHRRSLGEARLGEIIRRFGQSGEMLLGGLEAAIAARHAAALREAAHRLAGAAAGVGCLRLAERAAVLEDMARQGRLPEAGPGDLRAIFLASREALEAFLKNGPGPARVQPEIEPSGRPG